MPVLVVLAVVLVLLAVAVSLYTDYLWFDSVGYTEVFSTTLRTKILLFFLFGLLMAVAVGVNIYLAYRLRPPFRPMSLEQQNLERYRLAVEPYQLLILLGIPAILGVFAGLSASGRWQTWLLWRNRTDFGVQDPQFGRDVGYYVMTYPMQRFALGFVLAALVLALIAAAATHYLFGGLRLQTAGEKVSPAARAHLSVLVGLIVLCKAVFYYLDRFGLVFSERGFVKGAGYTDVNAVLPGKNILIGVAVICALLFFANVRFRNVLLPGGALGLLVIAAILLGGILPAFTQSARVNPNELDREREFIARNIAATQQAYGIVTGEGGNVKISSYGADPAPVRKVVSAKGTPNARLLDPNVLGPTFQQQRLRQYFAVNQTLDIDRYTENGVTRNYVVAARELNQDGLAANQRNWVNERLAFTHGNGLIAARADRVDIDGRPIFETGDDEGPFAVTQPRIYFGELSPSYSIVNTDTAEIDGPLGNSATEATSHYAGEGGVELSGFMRELAFALKFREPNVLLSGSINPDSRIMFNRKPRERVKKVAPFLEVDADPYPVADGDTIKWIVDAYTTTNYYPYSTSTEFGEVTQDSQTGQVQPRKEVNYIRNSVKAVVDAYTGEVDLYRFGDRDPLLEAWDAAFGGIVKDQSEIPASLREHLRYPEDLFKVQRELLGLYHLTDPSDFFNREDAWGIPTDPAEQLNTQFRRSDGSQPVAVATGPPVQVDTSTDGPAQPPYYSLLSFPTDDPAGSGQQFRLSTSFVFRDRPNLAAFASVSSAPSDYGTIRILDIPDGIIANGPGQVANQFLADPAVANELLKFRRTNIVKLGNLLTLPIASGLLYIQPVFVQAQSEVGFPLLRQVLVAYGDRVASAATFPDALAELLRISEAVPPPVNPPPPAQTPPLATPTPNATPPPAAPLPDDFVGLVQRAVSAFEAGQAALQQNPPDYAEYGRQQALLSAALSRLNQLQSAPAGPAVPAATPTN